MRKILILIALVPGAAAAQLAPGQWEMVTTIQQSEGGDIPPAILALIKRRPITIKQCITPEQAKSGAQEFFKAHKNCDVARHSMAGGRLTATTVCPVGRGQMTSTFEGTYTPTSFSGTSRQVVTGQGTPRTTVGQVAGRLVGPCK